MCPGLLVADTTIALVAIAIQFPPAILGTLVATIFVLLALNRHWITRDVPKRQIINGRRRNQELHIVNTLLYDSDGPVVLKRRRWRPADHRSSYSTESPAAKQGHASPTRRFGSHEMGDIHRRCARQSLWGCKTISRVSQHRARRG